MDVVDNSAVLEIEQLLEDGAEPAPSAVQPPTCGHRGRAEHDRDLRRGEPLPLGQQQNLAIPRAKATQCFVHEHLLPGGRRLLRNRGRLDRQPLVQCDATPARASLIRDHPPRGGVQPHAYRVALG